MLSTGFNSNNRRNEQRPLDTHAGKSNLNQLECHGENLSGRNNVNLDGVDKAPTLLCYPRPNATHLQLQGWISEAHLSLD